MTETDKQIQSILIALTKIEKTQEVTVNNVNKLSLTVDKLASWDEKMRNSNLRLSNIEQEIDEGVKPKTLKSFLIGFLTFLISFLSWLSLYTLSMDKNFTKEEVKQKELNKNFKEDLNRLFHLSNDNKNQITYLKGRIK